MRIDKIRRITVFSLILALCLIGIACNNNSDDDDDSEPVDPNGWNDGGCQYSYGSAVSASQSTVVPALSEPYEDCIPELPSNVDRDLLVMLLDGYLGEWIDQDKKIRTISCRPEGYWEAPNFDTNEICDYFWSVPVWIEYEDTGEKNMGTIIEDAYPLAGEGQLSFHSNEGKMIANYQQDDNGDITLTFIDPFEGVIWEKTQ